VGLLKRLWPLLALVVAAVGPSASVAQTLGAARSPGGPELPDWLMRWSPVASIGDWDRDPPGEGAASSFLLILPEPGTGSFWTAGNPAGLPWDVRNSYTQFRLGVREHSGDYRRPLDGGADTRVAASALGWKTVGVTGAAIGRATAEYLDQSRAAHSEVVLPYGGNPFVMLDTIGDAVSGLVARLEGAGGWRLGHLGLGLAVGFDGREVRTVSSPVPRQYRASASGASAGVLYQVLNGLLRVGVHGRWQQTAQFAVVSARTAGTRIYVLRGYSSPTIVSLGESNRVYSRRSDRRGGGLVGSLGGTAGGVTWTAYLQRNTLVEKQSIDLSNEPPSDEWEADGWAVGGAAQFTFRRALLVTLDGRSTTMSGEAVRMDLDSAHFTARDRAWRFVGDVRLPTADGWTVALRLATGRESRQARDSLARVGSDLKAWTPAASVEVGREIGAGLALALGAGYAQHAPWGAIPDPTTLSEAYRDWIAPELALYGTKSTTFSGSVTIRWRAGGGSDLWARGSLASLSPTSGIARLPAVPDGSRRRSMLELGFTMRER